MAEEPLQSAAASEDVPLEAPSDADAFSIAGPDRPLAWSSMDLPGMDPADGEE